MQDRRIDPSDAHRTFLILWFALLGSQLMFFVLLYFVKPELMKIDLSRPLLDENAVFVVGTAAISIINLVLSFVQRKKFVEQAIREQNVAHIQTAVIIGCALCESISLFGMFLAFAFNYPYFWLFFLLGILGTILHFPRAATVEAASFRKL